MINKEERRWGYFEVLEEFKYDKMKIKTKKLVISPDKNISYQYHNNRGENWYILEGNGELILDDKLSNIKAGDIINIGVGQKHTVRAIKELSIFEVQYGSVEPSEDDIERIELEWDKILNIIKK